MHYSILIQILHIFMKIATSINSGGDLHVHRHLEKCIMDVLHICALLLGQTEGNFEKYCIFAQPEVHYWWALQC